MIVVALTMELWYLCIHILFEGIRTCVAGVYYLYVIDRAIVGVVEMHAVATGRD